MSYEITPKDTVYAGRNDFYILPGLDVLYIPQYGNAKVRPAYGYTDTVGYSHVFSDKTMFTFNWFRTKMNNLSDMILHQKYKTLIRVFQEDGMPS